MKVWRDLEIGEEVKSGDRCRKGNIWVPALQLISVRHHENFLVQRPVEILESSISLEDHFAGLAMQGMQACPEQPQIGVDRYARDAYLLADAMMAEKKRRAEK